MKLRQQTSIEEIPSEKVAPIQRRLKLRSYRSENITSAIERFKAGEFSSIRKAAKECGVAYQTLRDRIAKGDSLNLLTKREVIVRVSKIAQLCAAKVPGASHANITRTLSQMWWLLFTKRHPELHIGEVSPIDAGRATVEPNAVQDYFQLLRKRLTDLGLDQKPENIWNVDESGFTMHENNQLYVVERSAKHNYVVPSASRDHYTVVEFVNADGQKLAPFTIFKGGLPHTAYHLMGPADAAYGAQLGIKLLN
uniref:Transposase n=1 Tax=Plectus sambesii TaxID=2011161 RepID=A0A914WUK4_9BILA